MRQKCKTVCLQQQKTPGANAQGLMCAQEQLQQSWTIEDVDVDWPLMNTWLSSCRV